MRARAEQPDRAAVAGQVEIGVEAARVQVAGGGDERRVVPYDDLVARQR